MTEHCTPGDVLGDGAKTYQEKNKDYGNSWQAVGEILYLMANEEPVTLDSPEDWIQIGLYTRRLDKMLRSFNGEFQADDMNFESVFDTHADESVYAAMAASFADEMNAERPSDD